MSLIIIVLKRTRWTLTYEHIANLMFAFKLITISGILTFCTIRRAMINLTTNEELRKDNYKYLKNSNGSFYNQFDKGSLWNNLKDYFRTSTFFMNKNRLFDKKRSSFAYQPLSKIDSFDFKNY